MVRPSHSHDDSTTHHLAKSLLFHEEVLQVGKNMTTYFPPAASAPLGLLPRSVADSIPFATSSLPSALAQLGLAKDSVQAAQMEETLDMCESPTLTSEAKFCATSLEALVEGAMVVLGTRDIRPVTSNLPLSGAPRQAYAIHSVRQVDGSSFVYICHESYYPYTVYICHDTGTTTRTYMVDMEGVYSGMAITVAAICHIDTSQWDPDHISFKLLGTKPGGAPICHYLQYGDMIWVNKANHWSS